MPPSCLLEVSRRLRALTLLASAGGQR